MPSFARQGGAQGNATRAASLCAKLCAQLIDPRMHRIGKILRVQIAGDGIKCLVAKEQRRQSNATDEEAMLKRWPIQKLRTAKRQLIRWVSKQLKSQMTWALLLPVFLFFLWLSCTVLWSLAFLDRA